MSKSAPDLRSARPRLYHAPQTRSLRVLWLLEELGEPYDLVYVDLKRGEQRRADFLSISPMGKVPALVDGDVSISESAAICTYLADKRPAARLAPPIDSPLRADYLRWMFFAVGCVEPAFTDRALGRESPSSAVAWGAFERVVELLSASVGPDRYLLGDQFTAVDVMLGSMVHWGLATGLLADRPALAGYVERLSRRPAVQRALSIDAGATPPTRAP